MQGEYKNKTDQSASDEMSFFEHLDELRSRLIKSIIAIVVLGIIIFISGSWTFDTVIFAPLKESFPTYQLFQNFVPSFKPPTFNLTTVEFGESFFVHIRVAMWLGLIISFPYVFYQIWSFIKPGLHDQEKKVARGTVFTCSSLFILGVLFGYFIVAPFGVTWLGNYTVGPRAINSPTLSSYVSYLTMFTVPTGIVFELPVVVYFLSRIGLINAKSMKKYRKHAFLVILILAAVITPPDVITQFLIGIPVFILYELSILISKRTYKKYHKDPV